MMEPLDEKINELKHGQRKKKKGKFEVMYNRW